MSHHLTIRRIAINGVLLAVIAGLLNLAQIDGAAQAQDDFAARILKDAIDIHAHIDPDSFGPNSSQAARAIDVDDLARLHRERGMRGFVAKQHYDTTAHVAYLVRKAVPGVEVFGLLGTNRAMGGVNPAAVLHMAEVKGGYGRIVNLPTWDAEFYVKNSKNPQRPFVPVSRNGELVPEVKEVIAIMGKTRTRDSNGQMVLYTGHSSPEEALMIVREARAHNVPVVMSHPMIEFLSVPLNIMEEAAKLGAYIEIVSGLAGSEAYTREHIEAIHKIGAEHFILSSDRGQRGGPLHPDAIVNAAKALMSQGITEQQINTMLKVNPARLLGLPTP